MNILPALYHEAVHLFGTSWGWGKTISFIDFSEDLSISVFFKRFVSKTPYFVHDCTETPHITGSGVLAVVDGLNIQYVCVCEGCHVCVCMYHRLFN